MAGNVAQYEVFLKAVETGSISRTAEALGYTQSGVSHAVAALEASLGFSLFTRSKAGVALTEKGRQVLPLIADVVQRDRFLAQTIDQMNNRVAGTLRLASFPSMTASIMPGIVAGFTERYPRTRIELFDGGYDDVRAWLGTSMVDCGLLSLACADGYDFEPLLEDPLVVVMAPDHDLTACDAIPPERLAGLPFVMQGDGCSSDVAGLLAGVEHGEASRGEGGERADRRALNVAYRFDDDASVLAFVARGLGVAIMPRLVLRGYSFAVETRPLDPPAARTIGLAVPRAQNSSLVDAFRRYLVEEVAQG